jgi:integrase
MLISEYLKGKGEDVPPDLLLAKKSRKALTIIEAADRWLTWSTTRHSPVERAHVRGMLKLLVGLFEQERADAIGPAELRELRRAMIAKNWSRTYVNDQIGRVKRMYKWLVNESLIPITTYQTLMVVSGLRRGEDGVRETKPVRVVEDDVVNATMPHLPEVVADMVRLQRLTGMRPAEVCKLRPCDLNRKSDVSIYRPATHKTQYRGRDRVIFIGPRGQEVLLRYLTRDAEACCFQPGESEAKRQTPRGRGKGIRHYNERYKVTAYRRAIHRACDKAFPHPDLAEMEERTAMQREELGRWKRAHRWSPNRLRHTAGTEVRRAFGLEAAQVMLGHAKADVTQVYAERDIAKGIEVARKIG